MRLPTLVGLLALGASSVVIASALTQVADQHEIERQKVVTALTQRAATPQAIATTITLADDHKSSLASDLMDRVARVYPTIAPPEATPIVAEAESEPTAIVEVTAQTSGVEGTTLLTNTPVPKMTDNEATEPGRTPTRRPTNAPSDTPADGPTRTPAAPPTDQPTRTPSNTPTVWPTATDAPSASPSPLALEAVALVPSHTASATDVPTAAHPTAVALAIDSSAQLAPASNPSLPQPNAAFQSLLLYFRSPFVTRAASTLWWMTQAWLRWWNTLALPLRLPAQLAASQVPPTQEPITSPTAQPQSASSHQQAAPQQPPQARQPERQEPPAQQAPTQTIPTQEPPTLVPPTQPPPTQEPPTQVPPTQPPPTQEQPTLVPPTQVPPTQPPPPPTEPPQEPTQPPPPPTQPPDNGDDSSGGKGRGNGNGNGNGKGGDDSSGSN